MLVPSWGDPSLIQGQQGSGGEAQESEGSGSQVGLNNGTLVPGSTFAGGFDPGSYAGENRPDLPSYYEELIIRYQEQISGN